MAEQVRLGIVGLGAQGSMYAQLITDGTVPNMEIGAICETNPVMAEAIRSTYPGVGFYRDLSTKEIVDGGEVGNIRHTSRCSPGTLFVGPAEIGLRQGRVRLPA